MINKDFRNKIKSLYKAYGNHLVMIQGKYCQDYEVTDGTIVLKLRPDNKVQSPMYLYELLLRLNKVSYSYVVMDSTGEEILEEDIKIGNYR